MNILLKKFSSACLIFGIIATVIFPKVSYAHEFVKELHMHFHLGQTEAGPD